MGELAHRLSVVPAEVVLEGTVEGTPEDRAVVVSSARERAARDAATAAALRAYLQDARPAAASRVDVRL